MSLSLKEAQAVADPAEAFYSFLPGTPHPYGNKQLSFPAVAADLGIGHHWPGGSKGPAITQLLTAALEKEKGRFSPLVIAIVRNGIIYRKNKEPVGREEIEQINAIIARIGYKIPDLHDPSFLDTLPRRSLRTEATKDAPDGKSVAELQQSFIAIQSMEPQPRGYALETFLSRLFELFGLAPRGSFRLRGEQIDGSFRLHAEVYLLEAKWRNEQAALADLLTFSGKVEGKAQWSRGLFVSYSGFTADGLAAFAQGRRTNIIAMDGLDLWHVVAGNLDLVEVLDRKARRAAETNQATRTPPCLSALCFFPGHSSSAADSTYVDPPPFTGARQRIFMSAALGAGGDLERLTGRKAITRLPVPEGWDRQGIGRRFFVFPTMSLKDEEAIALRRELMTRAGRSLVLVPSDHAREEIATNVSEKLRFGVFAASDIEESKTPFVSASKAVGVVANRYDGITFPEAIADFYLSRASRKPQISRSGF